MRCLTPTLAALAALLLPACVRDTPAPAADAGETAREADSEADGEETEMAGMAPGEARAAIASGTNRFGLALHGVLAREAEGNIITSPASISTAFGLAYAGAQGETASEIASVLHFPMAGGGFHPAMGALLDSLDLDADGRLLKVNNALWIDQTVTLKSEYEALTTRHYRAGAKQVDFRSAPQAARETINTWVEDRTNNRIEDLLPSDFVTPDTRVILVNTVYMLADWVRPFDANNTADAPFTLASGERTDVAMMNATRPMALYEGDGFKAVDLGYEGGELSFVLLVPDAPDGLPALEAALEADALAGWMTALDESAPREVWLKLPKFELKTKYRLTGPLRALGMNRAFANNADFTGITDENLAISDVVHQTFVKVDEKGTEAAAATAIGIRTTAIMTGPDPVEVHADKPFLFVIRDTRTNMVLFLGRVADPR